MHTNNKRSSIDTKAAQARRGQSVTEYALILALILLSAFLTLQLMGISVADVYARLAALLGGDACIAYDTGFDALDGWSPVTDNLWRGDMTTADGQLTGDPLSAITLDGFDGEDYVIDVGRVRLDPVRPVYQGYGVMFRSNRDDRGRMNGYMFEIEKVNPNDRGTMYFSKWVNGNQIRRPIASRPLAAGFDWQRPPHLKIAVAGDRFTAYFDGSPVLEGQDATYTDGTVGVAANWGSALTLDSLRVNDSTCEP
jgi:hypothetical protein